MAAFLVMARPVRPAWGMCPASGQPGLETLSGYSHSQVSREAWSALSERWD